MPTCSAASRAAKCIAALPNKPLRVLLAHLGCVDRAVTILVVISPKVAVPVHLSFAWVW